MNKLIATPDVDSAYHFEDLDCIEWAINHWNETNADKADHDTSDLSIWRAVTRSGLYLTFSTVDR